MKLFKKMKEIIFSVYMAGGTVFLAILILSAALQVFTRYITSNPLGWTDEVARYAFVWSSCLGAAVALDRGLHAGVTLLKEHLPPKGVKIQSVILNLIIIGIMSVVFVYGVKLTSATTKTPCVTIPLTMNYINVAIVFCAIGMIIAALYAICNTLFGDDEIKKEDGEC